MARGLAFATPTVDALVPAAWASLALAVVLTGAAGEAPGVTDRLL